MNYGVFHDLAFLTNTGLLYGLTPLNLSLCYVFSWINSSYAFLARIGVEFILFSASYQGQIIPMCLTIDDDGLSHVAPVVNNLPAVQKILRCRFNPWVVKIPWREGMATHSSILAWGIPRTVEPGRQQSTGSQRDHTTEVTWLKLDTT